MLLSSCLHSALLEVCAGLQRLWAVFTHAGNSSHLALVTKSKDFSLFFSVLKELISPHIIKQITGELHCTTGKSKFCPWTMKCLGKSRVSVGMVLLRVESVKCSAHSSRHKFIWNCNIDDWRSLEISWWLFSIPKNTSICLALQANVSLGFSGVIPWFVP